MEGGKEVTYVSVFVGVDEIDGFFECVYRQTHQHRTKDFFLVASHVLGDICNDGRTDKVAVGVLFRLETAAIENDFSTFLFSSANHGLDSLLCLRADDRTELGIFLETAIDVESFGSVGNIVNPALGVADKDDGGESHAALASSTESSTCNCVDSGISVAVGKHGSVVLCTQIGLDTLAVGRATGEDVFASLVAANEADGLDGGFVNHEVDGLCSTVDDVDDTRREASLLCKLTEDHHGTGVAL